MANPSMAAGGRMPLAEGVRTVGAQIRNRIRIFVFSLLPAPTERQTSKSLSLRASGRGWRAPHRRRRGWTSTASSTACAAQRPPASSAPSRASSPPSPSTSPAPRRTAPGSRPSSRRWRRPSGGTRSGPRPPTRKSTTRSRSQNQFPVINFYFRDPRVERLCLISPCVPSRASRSTSSPSCSTALSQPRRRTRPPTPRSRTRSASCSALSGPITSTYPRSSTTRLPGCIGDNKKAWKTGHCRALKIKLTERKKDLEVAFLRHDVNILMLTYASTVLLCMMLIN
ncbi:serine/arginine repetitive matrix protein 1 isoform X1 [Triticum aestivum]|uniref:serine/arginine repetitive matrix protein 1 isoform X1 n=1 Tax=Triticum aestivum TaxID=4565 RepID=UPI001D031461|nr:serine/arginine repetitive matrix protein 1-like isoform X1 [Triticum aestivum]